MNFFFKIARNMLAAIGIVAIFYFGFKLNNLLKRQKALYRIHEECKYLRKGMRVEEVYKILGNDIFPKPIIKHFSDSKGYHHYLQYPAKSAKESFLLIEVDPAERIIIDISGCD